MKWTSKLNSFIAQQYDLLQQIRAAAKSPSLSEKQRREAKAVVWSIYTLLTAIGLITLSIAIGAISSILEMFYLNAQYWTPAFMVAVVLGVSAVCAAYIWKIEKTIKSDEYLASRKEIAARFLQWFFDEHENLPVQLEMLAHVSEYTQRMETHYFTPTLPIFRTYLSDMSAGAGEAIDKKRLKVLHKQLQLANDAFFAEGQYVVPRIEGMPQIIIVDCRYHKSDELCEIVLVFCDSEKALRDFRKLSNNINAAKKAEKP